MSNPRAVKIRPDPLGYTVTTPRKHGRPERLGTIRLRRGLPLDEPKLFHAKNSWQVSCHESGTATSFTDLTDAMKWAKHFFGMRLLAR